MKVKYFHVRLKRQIQRLTLKSKLEKKQLNIHYLLLIYLRS